MSHEQGYLNVCLKLDFRGSRTVTGTEIDTLRNQVEEAVYEWEKQLHGQAGWSRTQKTPVKLFGIAVSNKARLSEAPAGVQIYRDACPDACSRFKMEKGRPTADYSGCTNPRMSHFDFDVTYSDYGFGAAGHGGDWGVRMEWGKRSDLGLLRHELGHTAGLPDVYTYPTSLAGNSRPKSIMAHQSTLQNFDRTLIQGFWGKSLAHHPEMKVPQCTVNLADGWKFDGAFNIAIGTQGSYDLSALLRKGFRNDALSAVAVNGDCKLVTYQHNFGGKAVIVPPGEYRSNALVELGVLMDDVSSVKILSLGASVASSDRQIKNRHGICLDASQRSTNGGKVHMWGCNTGNANQQWAYDGATGQIKSQHGICLDASQRSTNGGKVHMWGCNTGNANQQWKYNPTTGQIKSVHGVCLDASQRGSYGGKVHMHKCDVRNKNQQWSL